MKQVATWETWDESDREIAVARWQERDIAVVFPIRWVAHHGQEEMIARAKERIQEVERKGGHTVVAGSVLLAYSRHIAVLPRDHRIEATTSRDLLGV